MFRLTADGATLGAVMALCAVAFPLADPVLYHASQYAEKVMH